MSAVIVAESETGARGYLERQLADDGFEVLGAGEIPEVLDLAERLRPDLVVGTELELCRRLREGEPGRFWDRNVPVILLGRHDSDVVDRVRALERGADDYLGRPFSYEELLARIRAVLRRTSPRSGEIVRAGELEIDRVTRVARVLGQRLMLAAREYELLLRLAETPDARVHEGRAAARGVGVQGDGAHQDSRLPRLARAPQDRGVHGDAVRDQRVGGGLPADASVDS